MIQAIIFDFNGVIADDEAPHVACFRQALSEFGLSLSVQDYYETYLGMDERSCATMLATARGGGCADSLVQAIIGRKAELFSSLTAKQKPALFPGVVELVKAAHGRYRLAIASGGRRSQIAEALAGTPIERDFETIISAEDCPIGKPDPSIYRMTVASLNARTSGGRPLAPSECLVIEDSLAGIRAARQAGMHVLALATTYPAEKLCEADGILPTLRSITPCKLVQMVSDSRHQSRF